MRIAVWSHPCLTAEERRQLRRRELARFARSPVLSTRAAAWPASISTRLNDAAAGIGNPSTGSNGSGLPTILGLRLRSVPRYMRMPMYGCAAAAWQLPAASDTSAGGRADGEL